jgi:methyl-accepting chemotaxis protein
MGVRTKLVLLVAAVALLFIASFVYFLYAQKTVFIGLFEAESKGLQVNFDNILDLKGQTLQTYVNDYTFWDEMVDFVKSLDSQWAEQNIAASISDFDANIVNIYSSDFSFVYSCNNLDLKDAEIKEVIFPKDVISNLFKQKKLGHFFVNSNRGLWEFRCASIHPTADAERKTAPAGYFFAGRQWDEGYLTSLSNFIGGSVTIGDAEQIQDYSRGSDFKKGEIKFSKTLNDFSNKPVKNINLLLKSPAIQELNKKFGMFFIIIIVLFITIIFSVSVFLSLWIHIPLDLIAKSLENKNTASLKILQNRNDEFGEVARLINKFFLQQQELVNEIEQRKIAVRELGDKIKELENFKRLTVDRELKMIELKKEIATLKARIETPGT